MKEFKYYTSKLRDWHVDVFFVILFVLLILFAGFVIGTWYVVPLLLK